MTAASLTAAAGAIPTAARTAEDRRVVLITGTSSGFGRLAAEAFARRGWRTFATMRRTTDRNRAARAELVALAARDGLPIEVLDLDVTSDDSVERAVAHALGQTSGRLDVAINNAGIGTSGPLELHSPDVLRAQFETNVVGPHRIARAVLPAMRARRAGLILQISSGLGRIVNPLVGSYCATKFALEGLSESLRYEVGTQGVDVCLIIEPGPFPTRFTANTLSNLERMLAGLNRRDRDRAAAYGDHLARSRAIAAGSRAADPNDVVAAMVRLAEAPSGERPVRTVVAGPAGAPLEQLNAAALRIQQGFLQGSGLAAWFR